MNNPLTFPDNTPDNVGYYMVKYNNLDHNKPYYKAIWWDGTKWCGWRPAGWAEWKNNLNEHVYEFYPESYDEYYVPCMEKMHK